MLVAEPLSLSVTDASGAGEARRTAVGLAQRLGFNETAAGEVAIIATELASNLHRHAREGELIIQPLQTPAELGIELLAVDRGPGMANIGQAMRDGFSTGGTSGTGLGAVGRMADELDIFTEPDRGTIVMVRMWPGGKPAASTVQVGVVCLPKSGETACGDNWAMVSSPQRTAILVADGLGHGPGAATASRRAVDVFYQNADRPPAQIIDLLHAGLRGTRGAAVAVVEIRRAAGKLTFAGLGNISALLARGITARNMVSHNGTAGVEARRVQEFTYEWNDETLLVMHSDGLAQHWSLAAHRGLMVRCPSVIGALLYRDHRRERDDVTVLVARERPTE